MIFPKFLYDVFEKIVDYDNHIKTIDKEHYEIHEGDHYFIKGYNDFSGAGDTKYFLINCASTTVSIHFKGVFKASAEFTIDLFEGGVTSSDGTPITAYNNDRNSTNIPCLLAYATPTITSTGTLIWTSRTGAGRDSGFSLGSDYEIVTRYNTKYIWKITKAVAGDGYVDHDFFWYEESK